MRRCFKSNCFFGEFVLVFDSNLLLSRLCWALNHKENRQMHIYCGFQHSSIDNFNEFLNHPTIVVFFLNAVFMSKIIEMIIFRNDICRCNFFTYDFIFNKKFMHFMYFGLVFNFQVNSSISIINSIKFMHIWQY